MLVDIDIARDSTKFNELILQSLDMPSDSLIRSRRYGRVLKDHWQVRNGDTLKIQLIRKGLEGGMNKNKTSKDNTILPEQESSRESLMTNNMNRANNKEQV